jgi:hypothetical protein
MKRAIAALGLLVGACATNPPVGGVYSVPKDAGTRCVRHCESLEMRLAALVIISNSTGCVCEPRDSAPARTSARASAAVGGVIEIIESGKPPEPPEGRGVGIGR